MSLITPSKTESDISSYYIISKRTLGILIELSSVENLLVLWQGLGALMQVRRKRSHTDTR